MDSNQQQNKQAQVIQNEQAEAKRLKAQYAQHLKDNPLLKEILDGIRASCLTQLENSGINIDESMKIRLFDYYQSTGLIHKEIYRMIDNHAFSEDNMKKVFDINKTIA